MTRKDVGVRVFSRIYAKVFCLHVFSPLCPLALSLSLSLSLNNTLSVSQVTQGMQAKGAIASWLFNKALATQTANVMVFSLSLTLSPSLSLSHTLSHTHMHAYTSGSSTRPSLPRPPPSTFHPQPSTLNPLP